MKIVFDGGGTSFGWPYTIGTGSGNNIRWERAYAWWKPLEQVEFFLGRDGDGKFNSAGIIRWPHHQMDRGISVENWDSQFYLLGNWDDFGAAVTVRPIDGLAFNIAAKLPAGNIDVVDAFKDFLQIQASYAIPDIGTVYLTWRDMGGFTGNSGTMEGTSGGDDYSVKQHAPGAIGLTFESYSLVEGLAIIVGGNYVISDKYDGDSESMIQYNSPLRFALGAHYNIADFGVKTRFLMRPMDTGKAGDPTEGWFYLTADIMPFYRFSFATLYCNIRFQTGNPGENPTAIANKDGDGGIGWHINPYLRKQIGGNDLRLGFMLGDDNGDGVVEWKLPISAVVAF